MHWIDIVVIVLYMLLMIGVGWWASKKASKSAESYFLADKSLPWWIIGIAHGSSGLDVRGTMWFVSMFYIYGVKGIWLLWIWPLFNVIFRMVYQGIWVRRSNVLTGAEWMKTRFGTTRGAELAYISVVVYALITVVGFLNMAFAGIGKFAQPFFPWNIHPHYYAAVIMSVAGIYCVVGGMYSVIINDLIQLVLKLAAAVIIAVVAIRVTSAEQLQAAVPAGWDDLFFGWKLNLDWSKLMPDLMQRIADDQYSMYGLLIASFFVRGILTSMAGPPPNYSIQHVLSTRSPREAALENLVMAVVSLGPRFLLISAIAVLGIAFFGHDLAEQLARGEKLDFEQILPKIVAGYVPIGCKGLLVAAMVAAFMSNFVSSANSGVAYIVNDIYRRYINPNATQKKLVRLGYLWTVLIIITGIAFGLMTKSIHSITTWLTSSLVPAFVMPNVLKWHWWRFNGWGFFAGMVTGTLAAIVMVFFPINPMVDGLLILAVSGAASVVVCLKTPAEEEALLMQFYTTIRPWGFWGPILRKCVAENPRFQRNKDFGRDWFNIFVGLVWQIAFVTIPLYMVIHQFERMWIAAGVFAATSLILKFSWYDKLGPGQMYMTESGNQPS